MSASSLVIIILAILVFIILLMTLAKKLCNMAIKAEVTKEYSSLIFNTEKQDEMDKINEETKRWLDCNSQEVEIVSQDGLKLKGYEIKSKKSTNVWIIVVHGYMGAGTDMVKYAQNFISYGYNVLIIDLRAHGRSEGMYIGMGWLDRLDLELWIEKIIEENKQSQIILYGISMGSATVTMATGDKLPSEVKCCIADCGYSSVWKEFKIHFKQILHIPVFPLLNIASLMSKIFAGYSFKEASTIKQVRKSKTPTLFIHGTKDKFVPFKMLNEIYKNATCTKQKLEIEEAGHGESAEINPETYWKTIQKFINQYII